MSKLTPAHICSFVFKLLYAAIHSPDFIQIHSPNHEYHGFYISLFSLSLDFCLLEEAVFILRLCIDSLNLFVLQIRGFLASSIIWAFEVCSLREHHPNAELCKLSKVLKLLTTVALLTACNALK